MNNLRFYPAIERKNDFVVKNVKQVQCEKEITHTTRKTVLKGKILLGYNVYEVPNPNVITKEEWDKLICKSKDQLIAEKTIIEPVYK